VDIPRHLTDRYPDEMTIVIQNRFWDLHVSKSGFEVGLSFNQVGSKLSIPFAAITAFHDPAVDFALHFSAQADDQPPEEIAEAENDPVVVARPKRARTSSRWISPGRNKRFTRPARPRRRVFRLALLDLAVRLAFTFAGIGGSRGRGRRVFLGRMGALDGLLDRGSWHRPSRTLRCTNARMREKDQAMRIRTRAPARIAIAARVQASEDERADSLAPRATAIAALSLPRRLRWPASAWSRSIREAHDFRRDRLAHDFRRDGLHELAAMPHAALPHDARIDEAELRELKPHDIAPLSSD
jgi:hypothetical protein